MGIQLFVGLDLSHVVKGTLRFHSTNVLPVSLQEIQWLCGNPRQDFIRCIRGTLR